MAHVVGSIISGEQIDNTARVIKIPSIFSPWSL